METQSENPISFAPCLNLGDSDVIRFEIRGSHAKVFLTEKSSIVISLSSLATTLSELTKVRENITTGSGIKLPFGTYLLRESEKTLCVGMYEEGSTKEILYSGNRNDAAKKYKIPFPNMIVTAQLNKTVKDGHSVWTATAEDVKFFATPLTPVSLPQFFFFGPNREKQVSALPLPNFYGGNHMCVGHNSVPTIFPLDDVSNLRRYFHILYESPFNDDLSIRGLKESMPPKSWIEYLSKQETFPYDLLN